MGVVADFASVPEDVWLAVLPYIRARGVEVEAGEWERGIWWYDCIRGRCSVGLTYSPKDRGCEVIVYSSALRFWPRPLGMWRLFRDVRRAVLTAGGKSVEPSATADRPRE
jgi:hypothetical protein